MLTKYPNHSQKIIAKYDGIISNCDSLVYYKVRWTVITNCDSTTTLAVFYCLARICNCLLTQPHTPICDHPQDFEAKGESMLTTRLYVTLRVS